MDRRATLLSIAMPPVILASFILGFFARTFLWGEQALGDKVRQAAVVIHDRYYVDVPEERLERGAMDGLVGTLDKFCGYYTKKEYEEFSEKNKGNFFGVGIRVMEDRESGYLKIVTPIKDSPAYAADILPDDLLVKVDGEELKGKPQNEVVPRIKGPLGTKVVLTIRRKGREDFDVPLVRAKVTTQAVRSRMLDGKIGYVRVEDFTEMLPQFDAAVSDLRAQGMKGLVIDLRFNGGGLLDSAIGLSDRFVEKGKLIVSTRGRQPDDVENRVAEGDEHDVPPSLPVVILANNETASASEVFAGCLRDYGRAKLVGTRTYGKGVVQTPIRLADGSCVKLTTARYFTPKGTCVQREEGKREYGLDPDYLVELTADEYSSILEYWSREGIEKRAGEKPKPPKDLQLDAAVEVVNAEFENRPPKVEKREVPPVPEKPEKP